MLVTALAVEGKLRIQDAGYKMPPQSGRFAIHGFESV
jgi:hypothetical protein